MRVLSPATLGALAAGQIVARPLIWIRAVDRATGAAAPVGFWTGEEHRDFTVGGAARSYYGAGNVLGIDAITYQTGISVRMQRLRLSAISDEAALAVRGYEPRHAPVEIHRALFDPLTYQLVDAPHRLFKGYVDTIRISTAAKGGQSSMEVSLASSARALTVAVNRKRSDEALRAWAPTEGFRKYATIAGTISTKWGSA